MQKPRVNVHVTEEVWRRLDRLADRPDISKAAIVDAALERDELILNRSGIPEWCEQ